MKTLLITVSAPLVLTGCSLISPPVDIPSGLLSEYPVYQEPTDTFDELTERETLWVKLLLSEVRANLPKPDYKNGIEWQSIHAKNHTLYYRFAVIDDHSAQNMIMVGMKTASDILYSGSIEAGANCADTQDELHGMQSAGVETFHADWVYEGRIIAHFNMPYSNKLCGIDGKAPVFY